MKRYIVSAIVALLLGTLPFQAKAYEVSTTPSQQVIVNVTTAQLEVFLGVLKNNNRIVEYFDVQDGMWSLIYRKNHDGIVWTLDPNVPHDKIGTMIHSYRNNGFRTKQMAAYSPAKYALLLVKQGGHQWDFTANLSAQDHQHHFGKRTKTATAS